MMKKLFVTLFILLVSIPLIAQNLKRANSLFERKSFVEAAELYETEEPKTQEIYEKLGDCYFFNSEMKQASLYYKILVSNYKDSVKPIYLFRYSQTLKGINNIDEANKWLLQYQEIKNSESNQNIENGIFFKDLNNDSKILYRLFNISSNSTSSDFGAAFNNNTIVFSSARNKGALYDWNNQPYLDLFQAEKNESGDLLNVVNFSNDINTKMHESNAVFTKDGKTMYFTRNNFIHGKKGKDQHKISHLKIYKAEFLNDQWTNITELPFNSDSYSTEHPALSPDEKQLYFASDMPGTIGSFDIFVVSINSDGTYGSPKNLGPFINTEFREQFPFISSTNTLFFASDGHFGYGSLDIFKSEFKNNNYSKPINLGKPINSNLDDFALIFDDNNNIGYFSSNRPGGAGDDDLYGFTQIINYSVQGVVQDKNTSNKLPGALVKLYDENNKLIAEAIADKNGFYTFKLEKNKTYKIIATNNLYVPTEEVLTTNDSKNPKENINLKLERFEDKEENIVVENNKLQIKIAPIYFNFNKWDIRPDAALELDNVVSIMKKYPTMVIEIGAHTDFRGDEDYNLMLSDKRAQSVRDYLVSQGISNDNVKSVGYGETQPINNCTKPGICSKESYSLNRRCEFVILN